VQVAGAGGSAFKMKIIKSFCGCFTDRGGFFKKNPWPPEAEKR
jgi:hypothetical protein